MKKGRFLLMASFCGVLVSGAFDRSLAQSACGGVQDELDLTCVPLSGTLLMSLRFAPRADVLKVLHSSGENMSGGGLHFRSLGSNGGGSGDLLITFGANDRVSGIVATVDQGAGGATQMFNFSALRGRACGDLAGVPSCTAKQ